MDRTRIVPVDVSIFPTYLGKEFYYNEITNIPPDIETTVLSVTSPETKVLKIYSIRCSGNVEAEFSVYIDGEIKLKKWSSTSERSVEWLFSDFDCLEVPPNSTISVKVKGSLSEGLFGNYSASIIGVLV